MTQLYCISFSSMARLGPPPLWNTIEASVYALPRVCGSFLAPELTRLPEPQIASAHKDFPAWEIGEYLCQEAHG